ncbi:MAG: HipA domain-containing protein [Alphaproteobacteria bacterium]|jgi:serine/threonine-protein kinase HipA|nr:HipA domain-containing protein [Alphaproteobacteria bacterium]
MTSNNEKYTEAFVWIWLPNETEPVVAGKLTSQRDSLVFNYGQSYLSREDAIAIYEPELPLEPGLLPLLPGMSMPSCIRDGSPDAWGRRVIINKNIGNPGSATDTSQLDELTYLLESGSDRIGALDFQLSPTTYEPRDSRNVPLEELLEVADRVEKGLPISHELDAALNHGTSIGGARPKALIEEKGKKYIAKFSSTTDIYGIVKAEFIAMRLAKLAGLTVAPVLMTQSSNKDVLLIERFDRIASEKGWNRRCMVSSLTLLALDEMMARYASYENLAEIIRHRFTDASITLKELFGRVTFSILVGNTDDHARNHAAFWDGKMLSLTPAYDICPQGRTGNEASQAMFISENDRRSKVSVCLNAAPLFLLTEKEATSIVESQLKTIKAHWHIVCVEAKITEIDKKFLMGRQFLNPFAFDDLEGERSNLKEMADMIREKLA